MQFDNSIIDAYVEDRAISKETMYSYIKGYHTPDAKRKDVVVELNQQLQTAIEQYPTFNPDIFNELFKDKDEFLDTICICPIVGSDTLYYCETIQDQLYVCIDLICVANHTRIISQMVYILNNILTLELSKACILQEYPLDHKEYSCLLDAATFVHGLAHWIAWNVSCEQYVFYTNKYEAHREKAFGLLSEAIHVDNKATQEKILNHIRSSNLWEQFPIVAGMFYFDDTYREFGMQGIKQLYHLGPKGFIYHIFNS